MSQRYERLTTAIRRGDEQTVRTLLDAGADPNVTTPDGTVLELAAATHRPAIARMLWRAGAQLTERALHLTVMNGADAADQHTLLQEMADACPREWVDQALQVASFQSPQTLLLLLELGASPHRCRAASPLLLQWLRNCPDPRFDTASMQARTDRANAAGDGAVFALLGFIAQDLWQPRGDTVDSAWLQALDGLLDGGAPLDALDATGWSPLWIALDEQLPFAVIERLVQHGADPSCGQVESLTLAQLLRCHPDPRVEALLGH